MAEFVGNGIGGIDNGVKRLLALDVGERRIGVAVSDPTGIVARPLTTIVRASRKKDFKAIARLVEENQAGKVIVGLPLSLDGTEGPQAQQIRRYGERLAQTLSVPILFWDERYSTVTAKELLKDKGKRRPAREDIDAVAAAVFLQSYLDAQASNQIFDHPDW
jgi:putative Holliday junction resolvase